MEKDLNNLVKDLRSCAESIWKITCHQCGNDNEEECRIFDRHLLVEAAAAIEDLQAEVKDAFNEGYNAGYTAGIGYCSFKRAKMEVQDDKT